MSFWALHKALNRIWYQKAIPPVLWPLIPFSIIYSSINLIGRLLYRFGIFSQYQPTIPVIVVGNLTTGGTGKTPLVIHLVNLLKQHGFHPGIVSRGYGGRGIKVNGTANIKRVCEVFADSDPAEVGDEALLLVQKTKAPMVIGKNRPEALKHLMQLHSVDVVVSDDGLQHYALGRELEVLVIDGKLRFGNGFCLPAGPLREPISRMKKVDFVITNGGVPKDIEYDMHARPGSLYNLFDPKQVQALESFKGKRVHAVAGIGHPERFFNMLMEADIQIDPHAFPDHYLFNYKDIQFQDDFPVIMTEKDAVKIARLMDAGEDDSKLNNIHKMNYWVLPIKTRVNPLFDAKILNRLYDLRVQKESLNGYKATRHFGMSNL